MLESMGLTHYWTYPKSPRMNAHCERFNRTIQEQFVDWHEELLFTDLELFNQKLGQWLIDYNTVLPHHSLGLKAPVQWLLENHKECQRYWTNTSS
nr:integrase core domain-containing protein [Hydrogenophilus thiooxidans]